MVMGGQEGADTAFIDLLLCPSEANNFVNNSTNIIKQVEGRNGSGAPVARTYEMSSERVLKLALASTGTDPLVERIYNINALILSSGTF
jgi:hypothetical protein